MKLWEIGWVMYAKYWWFVTHEGSYRVNMATPSHTLLPAGAAFFMKLWEIGWVMYEILVV
jgi:hypothetical protein